MIQYTKVGRVFRMVMSSEFRMGQYIDDDHREDVPHFIYNLTVCRTFCYAETLRGLSVESISLI